MMTTAMNSSWSISKNTPVDIPETIIYSSIVTEADTYDDIVNPYS